MPRLKIREKILIFSILISAVPIALINTYWFTNATSIVKQDAGAHLRVTNDQIANNFNDFLNTKLLGFLSHSQGAALLSRNQQLILNDLFNFLLQDSDIEEIAFVDTKGQEVAKVNTKKVFAKNELKNVSNTDAFKIVNFQYGKEYIGPVTFTPDKLPQAIIAVPVVNPGQLPALQTFSSESLLSRNPSDIHGYLIGTVTLSRPYQTINSTKIGENGYIYIVNREGRILMHPNNDHVGSQNNLNDSEVAIYLKQIADNQSKVNETKSLEGKNVLSTHKVVDRTNWAVIAEQPISDISTAIDRAQRQALPLVLIPLATVVILSFIGARRITNPIKQLAIGAHKIGTGDFSYKFSIKSHDELETLADSLRQMAHNLEDSQNKLEHERDSLQVERDKLESVLSNIDDGVIALNEKSEILFFNKAVENIMQLKFSESVGHKFDSLMELYKGKEPTTMDNHLKTLKDDDKSTLLSFQTHKKNEGRIRLTVTRISSSHIDDIKYLCTIQDVTKEEQLEEMKMDFVSMAAHELRTPLTSIRGYFSLINGQIEEKLTTEQKMFMNRIDISTQQLISLVENLLSVTRIEKGTYTLKKTDVDLENLIEQDIKDFQVRIKEKSMEVIYQKSEEKLPQIYIDPLGISEVIRNLLSNAINYTPPEGKVTIWLEKNDKEIITHIKDTGEGMPKEAIPHLFTKFFRVSGSLEQGSKGNGLGLYISKSILDKHHGRIWVESEQGKGSTFSFSLPIRHNE